MKNWIKDLIIILIFAFLIVIIYYQSIKLKEKEGSIIALSQELKDNKKKEELLEKLLVYLDQLNKYNPSFGDKINEYINNIDIADLDAIEKITFNEFLYSSERIENHGISKYKLRYSFLKIPIRNINNTSIVDTDIFVSSEYGPRWIINKRSDELNAFLKTKGIYNSYEGWLTINPYGYCYVKINRYNISYLQSHAGVDIVSKYNYGVFACAGGKVIRVGKHKIFGNYITILHSINGDYYRTNYCHLSAINVKLNQEVDENTWIGIIGNTGDSFGDHLHWSILKYDKIRKVYITINPFVNSTYNNKVSMKEYTHTM